MTATHHRRTDPVCVARAHNALPRRHVETAAQRHYFDQLFCPGCFCRLNEDWCRACLVLWVEP